MEELNFMNENLNHENNNEVPQINSETGVSQDYANQFNGIVNFYQRGDNGIDLIKTKLKIHPFHMYKYEEAYIGYKNIINDKNRDSIKRIDELADQMNNILKDPDSIDENKFKETCNELYLLIFNNTSKNI